MPETPETPHPDPDPFASATPPPLTVAASLVGVQGVVLLLLALAELANISPERRSLGLSTAVFFAAYAVVLVAAGWALWRRLSWARGPVLLTQLIWLGIAFSVREHVGVAIGIALVAAVVLAGVLSPASVAALDRAEERPSD